MEHSTPAVDRDLGRGGAGHGTATEGVEDLLQARRRRYWVPVQHVLADRRQIARSSRSRGQVSAWSQLIQRQPIRPGERWLARQSVAVGELPGRLGWLHFPAFRNWQTGDRGGAGMLQAAAVKVKFAGQSRGPTVTCAKTGLVSDSGLSGVGGVPQQQASERRCSRGSGRPRRRPAVMMFLWCRAAGSICRPSCRSLGVAAGRHPFG